MLSLMRRDPILGSMTSLWGGVVALNAGVLAGFVTTLSARSASRTPGGMTGTLFLAGLIWFSISLFLLFGKSRERCRTMDLALPIPARRLWLAHVSVLILLGLVFLAMTMAILWILFWAFRNAPVDFSMFKQALTGLTLPFVAGLVLVVVLLQRFKASLCRIPRSRLCTAYSILLLASGFGLILLLEMLPAPAALVPLGLGFILGYRTYRSLPAGFTWMPAEAGAGSSHSRAIHEEAVQDAIRMKQWERLDMSRPVRGYRGTWFLIRMLFWGSGYIRFATFFLFPMFFLWGFLMSGFFAAWRDLELPQFAYVVLSGFLLLSYFPAQLQQLHFVEYLPISRKRIAAILLIPGFLILTAGLLSGGMGATILERSQLQVQFHASPSSYYPPYGLEAPMVRVPAQYGGISWDGDTPDTVAPWGESHPVWKYPLFSGSRIMVFSPFSTPEGSSPRFIAFQISRALQAIYGTSIPYQEILDRYLEVSPDKTAVLEDPARLLADHPEWKPRGNIPLIAVLTAAIGIVYSLMASIYFRSWRATVSDTGRKAWFFVLAVIAVASTAIQVLLMIARWIRPDPAAAFVKILMLKTVQAVPGGALTAWVFCLLVLLVAYRLVRRRFDRVEALPGQTGRFCL